MGTLNPISIFGYKLVMTLLLLGYIWFLFTTSVFYNFLLRFTTFDALNNFVLFLFFFIFSSSFYNFSKCFTTSDAFDTLLLFLIRFDLLPLLFTTFLDMIHFSGDIYEKRVPQHPLPFFQKHEILNFLPNGKLHTFWW